jgi:Fe2+ or Zn2+ uptake regulation protein
MTFLVDAQQAIKDAGGRMTEQRRLIVELLAQTTEQFDAEGLYLTAREQNDGVSLATVYRTLNILETYGLIAPHYVSRDHERKYYELSNRDEYYHFTCRNCRKVIPFRSDRIQALKAALEQDLGIEVMHACVCFDGLCADCRED